MNKKSIVQFSDIKLIILLPSWTVELGYIESIKHPSGQEAYIQFDRLLSGVPVFKAHDKHFKYEI